MTKKERYDYVNWYVSRIKIFEKKYSKSLTSFLKSQISKVIHVLENSGIDAAIHETRKIVLDPNLSHLLTILYTDVGVYFAKQTTRDIKHQLAKSGGIGSNPKWIRDILKYFQTHLLNKAVIPINKTTRTLIEKVLSEAEEGGWGINQTVKALESPSLTSIRAELIARTESAKAAFVGRKIAVQDTPFEMNKEWITAHDSRVRIWHQDVDGRIIQEDELFMVDGEEMEGPGDPEASPENVCNCRCVLAFVPRRNKNGRLIPKNLE